MAQWCDGRNCGSCGRGFLAVVASSVAHAKGEYKYWPSSGSISVSGYGSTAWAYGQWRVADSSAGTRSWLDSYTWYVNADDHKKYAHFQTRVSTLPGGPFNYYAEAETSHSNQQSGQWLYANTAVSPSHSYARAHVRVCLDIPFRTDPCSGFVITGVTSY